MTDIQEGTYRIENTGFDESPPRVLDLKGSGSAAGTPIISYSNHDGDNQKWAVTKFNGGYNFQAVDPASNAFIGSIGPGEEVTGTPLQKTAFKLHDAGGNNRYQITAEANGRTYAFQAPDSSSETIVLRPLVATNTKQIWRFVLLS